MTLGEKLKELRGSRKMTQAELASELYVSRPMIAKYETGKAYPTNEILQRIADFFDISVDELVQKEELIEEHSKALEEKMSKNKMLTVAIAIIGVLLLAAVAILSVIEVDSVTTEVDFVEVKYDVELMRWELIYFESSSSNIWQKKEYLYLSEFQENVKDSTQFTVDGGEWFHGIYHDPKDFKSATLYYRVTVRKNLLGIVQGKGYFLERVDFHIK